MSAVEFPTAGERDAVLDEWRRRVEEGIADSPGQHVAALLAVLAPHVAAREAQAAARARDGAADAWDAQRHADAIGDTGTSHVPLGRVYAVRCEWCPKIFVGNNKREAMAEFRRHERAVLDQAHRIERGESS